MKGNSKHNTMKHLAVLCRRTGKTPREVVRWSILKGGLHEQGYTLDDLDHLTSELMRRLYAK